MLQFSGSWSSRGDTTALEISGHFVPLLSITTDRTTDAEILRFQCYQEVNCPLPANACRMSWSGAFGIAWCCTKAAAGAGMDGEAIEKEERNQK